MSSGEDPDGLVLAVMKNDVAKLKSKVRSHLDRLTMAVFSIEYF